MGKVEVTAQTIIARSSMGRFIAACEAGITESVREAISMGARLANDAAPSGRKPNRHGVKLKGSFIPIMLSSTSGTWGSEAPHAKWVIGGTQAHPISGPLGFYWEKEGRDFTHFNPDFPKNFNPARVKHPGTEPDDFLTTSYRAAGAELMRALKRNVPG